jgi:transposase
VSTAVVVRAYRFALDPTPAQARALDRHGGAARFAYNWALAAVKANIDQRRAERSYGLNDDQLTPALGWNLPALRRRWNQAKGQVAPWWGECSKEAFNTGLDGVARALRNFDDSRSGRRAGRRVGFPRFKSRRRATPSVRFTTGAIRVGTDRHHVILPRVGRIKTHESTRKLARRLEAGTARIMSATVRREGHRWYCAFTVRVHRAQTTPARPDDRIGVDVGISTLAVLSTGQCLPNPRHLGRSLSKLRTAARTMSRRTGPDRRTGQRPSKRWARVRNQLSRLHARVGNQRRDGLHKLTSSLTATYGTVVVEDLNVAGMLKNPKLARHLADAGNARDPTPTRLQDDLERRPARHRRPLVPLLQDVLGLPDGETQTVPGHTHLHLRALWSGHRPGPQRRDQPPALRRPEWLGDTKRTWSRPEDRAWLGRWL